MLLVDLGKRIRLLRKQKGLSQEHFAMAIDMDRTYLSSVESGKRNISIINAAKIAEGFSITLSDLFDGIHN